MPSMELQQMFSFEQMVLYRLRGEEWIDAGRGGVRLWGRPTSGGEKSSGVFRFVSVGTKRTLFEDQIDKDTGVYLDAARSVVVLIFDRRKSLSNSSTETLPLKDVAPDLLKTKSLEFEVLVIKSLQRTGTIPGEPEEVEEEQYEIKSVKDGSNDSDNDSNQLDEQDWSIGAKEQKQKEEERRRKQELINRLLFEYPLNAAATSDNTTDATKTNVARTESTDAELAASFSELTTTTTTAKDQRQKREEEEQRPATKAFVVKKEFPLRVAEKMFSEIVKTSATRFEHDPLGVLAPEDD